MKQAELLSPAGDLTSLRAAIHNGADAVYLGARSFGARASKGFDDNALDQAIRYAHLYGKRVYVTVNTLIKPKEFEDLTALLHTLDDLKADAIIVQDLGLVRYARRQLPHLPLHASTQMSIHNARGAEWLKDLGLTRVVAARECSLDTLRAMAASGLETEVFVHGALCVSQSGQCLMSSMIGGRSGNRGRCAQPCRMQYGMGGKEAAWLSPRDIALIDNLDDLMDIGVTSFKIEGRLKRPEYVAVVTDIYRRSLDYLADPTRPAAPTEHDRNAQLQIFNRGGFSGGYLKGPDDAAVMNPARVSHDGAPLGRVQSTQRNGDVFLSRIKLDIDLHDGDHLQIRADTDQEMIYAGPPVAAGKEAVIRHYKPAPADAGVYRLTDARQIAVAQESIERKMPPIPVDMALRVSPGKESELLVTANGTSIRVIGAAAEPAQSRALDRDTALRSLSKTGDTPFSVGDFAFKAEAPSFLPVAALNALRREALVSLERAIISDYRRQAAPSPTPSPTDPSDSHADTKPKLWVRTSRATDLAALKGAGADHVVYSPQSFEKGLLEHAFVAAAQADAYVSLPGQCSDAVLDSVTELARAYNVNVMLDNAGQLGLSFPGERVAGNAIPAWNAEALGMLDDMGINRVILSRELGKEDVESLTRQRLQGMDLVLPVYGRARVMTLNHCPARLRAGKGSGSTCANCRRDGGHHATLSDQFGYTFPLQPMHMPEGCINHLLFHTPLHMGKHAPRMSWLLDMTDESSEAAIRITKWYRALMDEQSLPDLDVPEYLGRWLDGVA